MVSDSPLTAGQSAEPRSFFLEAQGEDRGSGRLHQPALIHQAAIRGSGRISPTPPTPDVQAQTTAYRGSGRIDPHSPNRV
ncbi:hypothetical protein GFS31_32390 [Leptolyngbya sp. BL0902]|nr:hypothetical protein GFS31_32390 [Leptolyngbya sp. BL0902]